MHVQYRILTDTRDFIECVSSLIDLSKFTYSVVLHLFFSPWLKCPVTYRKSEMDMLIHRWINGIFTSGYCICFYQIDRFKAWDGQGE